MKRGTPGHPKTLALVTFLGIERYAAVGILESLWHFAAQYARRGDIGRHSNAAISQAIGWQGDADALVKALVDSKWLDPCPCHRLRIHDWPEHADQAVQKTQEVKKQGFLPCYACTQEETSIRPPEVLHPKDSGPLPKDKGEVAEVHPPPATAQGNGNGSGGGVRGGALTPRAEQERYIREVWKAVLARGGPRSHQASSADFTVALEWFEEGVPLPIVLRGIEACSKAPPSLAYAKPAVAQAMEHWRKALA